MNSVIENESEYVMQIAALSNSLNVSLELIQSEFENNMNLNFRTITRAVLPY